MLTALLLCLAAQTGEPAPAKDEPKFSESFRRRREWEKAQQRPSWTDEVAFAVAGYGSAHFFTDRALPQSVASAITVDLEFGAHLIPQFALVGTAQVRAAFLQPGTEVVIAGLGGGIRLGSRHFVSSSFGLTTVNVMRADRRAVSGLAPHLELRGAVVLVGSFGVHLRAGMVFSPTGLIGDVGLGFGFST